MSYHLTQTYVQLLYPQTYHHMHGGYSEMYDNQVIIYFNDNWIHIHIERVQKNLPIVYNSLVSYNEKKLISPQMHSLLSHTRQYNLDIFGDLSSMNNLQVLGISDRYATFENELE